MYRVAPLAALLLGACSRGVIQLPTDPGADLPTSPEALGHSGQAGASAPGARGPEAHGLADSTEAEVWTLEVLPPASPILADGRSVVSLVYTLRDAEGLPAPEGSRPSIQSTHGQVIEVGGTRSGVGELSLDPGTWPGWTTLSSPDLQIQGSSQLELQRGQAVAMQLHTHGSISEGAASMIDHADDAEATGLEVLWWTDHAEYYPQPGFEFDTLGFESGSLVHEGRVWPGNESVKELELSVDQTQSLRSEVLEEAAHSGSYGWRIIARGNDAREREQYARWEFLYGRSITWRPLLADVSLSFAVRAVPVDDPGELRIVIPLSTDGGAQGASADTGEPNRIVLYTGPRDHTDKSDERTLYVPFETTPDSWTLVEANLTELGRELSRGIDVHAELLTVEVHLKGEETAAYDLDEFRWWTELHAQALVDAQRDYVRSMPRDLTQYVGYEASVIDGPHVNAYGSDVPLPPKWIAKGDCFDVVQFIHDHGGLASYNHMFGTGGGTGGTEEENAAQRERVTEELLATEAYGADLIEVGYRMRNAPLADLVAVWDELSAGGLWITGVGSGDNHNREPTRLSPNNFVTWVAASSDQEDELMWALGRGDAWFGDPTHFPDGDVDLELSAMSHQATMGQVVAGAEPGLTELRLRIDPLYAGWTVRLFSRTDAQERVVVDDGPFDLPAVLWVDSVDHVRAEVYDETGDLILLSNPIYFVEAERAEQIPYPRLPRP